MATRSLASWLGVTLVTAHAATAFAADNASAQSAPEQAPAAAASADANIRRDPAGHTGISPTWEAIRRGDEAYVAKDIDKAIQEYQAAIEAHPQNPVPHYRLASALIAKGDLKQAQDSLTTALRYAQLDGQTAAKVLFMMADLKERQQEYEAALAAWKSYAAFAAGHSNIKTFPDSAKSRQDKIAFYTKLLEQSKAVKQRIAERLELTAPDKSSNKSGGKKSKN
jgi:tetratricopeptide (TPR) repeat protein